MHKKLNLNLRLMQIAAATATPMPVDAFRSTGTCVTIATRIVDMISEAGPSLTPGQRDLAVLIVGSKQYENLLENPEFTNYFDATYVADDRMIGFAGHVLGCAVLTDLYMTHDNLMEAGLDPDAIYAIAYEQTGLRAVKWNP